MAQRSETPTLLYPHITPNVQTTFVVTSLTKNDCGCVYFSGLSLCQMRRAMLLSLSQSPSDISSRVAHSPLWTVGKHVLL